jgi:GNAT superfamily N-acetyltransferase
VSEFSVSIRQMKPGEEGRVCHLVHQVFNDFVAPRFEQEGVEEFLRYADPILMAKRAQSNQLALIAEANGELYGIIEMVNFNHISLLFVARKRQHQGIGRQLLKEALTIARRYEPNLSEIDVDSSPNAVDAYERLGFQIVGSKKLENGISFVLMRMYIHNAENG